MAGDQQLVDFGLGVKFSDEDERFREDVGSLYYVAPEVLGRNYTKVNLLCSGVALVLCCGFRCVLGS